MTIRIFILSIFSVVLVHGLSNDDVEQRLTQLENALTLQDQRHAAELSKVEEELGRSQQQIKSLERLITEVTAENTGLYYIFGFYVMLTQTFFYIISRIDSCNSTNATKQNSFQKHLQRTCRSCNHVTILTTDEYYVMY